jgi:hypothetical protein
MKRINVGGRLGGEFKRPHIMPEAGIGYEGCVVTGVRVREYREVS